MTIQGHVQRDKSHHSAALRSKSQPTAEHRLSLIPPLTATGIHPMKTYFENILHLKPYRYVSASNSFMNRTKISSGSSIVVQSDHSSHSKVGQPSVVSLYSTRSTNVTSLCENRV